MRNKLVEREHLNILDKRVEGEGNIGAARECADITEFHSGKFAEWLQQNRWFWFTASTNKWHYTWPVSSLRSEVLTKTTKELFQDYLDSFLK